MTSQTDFERGFELGKQMYYGIGYTDGLLGKEPEHYDEHFCGCGEQITGEAEVCKKCEAALFDF